MGEVKANICYKFTVMFFPFTITIAAEGANPVGDTFSRLLESYFCSLGYENLHFNVHKSGREIDVDATHRTENRRLVAEVHAAHRG